MSRHCSFCGLPEEVLKTLFMKDDLGICDRCVECCNLIMAEPRISGAKEYDSWQLPQSHEGDQKMTDLMFERLKLKAEYAKKLLNMPQQSISQAEHTMLTGWIQEYESHPQFAAGERSNGT